MRSGNPGVPTISEWLNEVLIPGCRVGIDPVSYLFYNDVEHERFPIYRQARHMEDKQKIDDFLCIFIDR